MSDHSKPDPDAEERMRRDLLLAVGAAPLSPFLQRHRTQHIARRVRFLSAVLAPLFLAWIAVDYAVFEWPLWGAVAAMRLTLALILLYLARIYDPETSRLPGFFALVLFIAGPVVLYLLSNGMIVKAAPDGLGAVVAAFYPLLPVMMLAALALFPLTLFETAAVGLPVIAAVAYGSAAGGGIEWVGFARDLWMVGLILVMSAAACVMQLRYMTTLVRQASFDPLTGAYSRDSGSEVMDVQFHIAERQNAPFSIALLDLDNFKAVNDTYGHHEGDRILRQMVDVLTAKKRDADVVVRWGGEEFLLVLPNTDVAGARVALMRLMDGWFGKRPDGTPLTASIGVAERDSDNEHDWRGLIELADRRMYEAKRAGRSRAVLPGDETMATDAA